MNPTPLINTGSEAALYDVTIHTCGDSSIHLVLDQNRVEVTLKGWINYKANGGNTLMQFPNLETVFLFPSEITFIVVKARTAGDKEPGETLRDSLYR